MDEEKRGAEEKKKINEQTAARVRTWKLTQRVRMVIQIVFVVVFPSAFASAFAAVKETAAAFSTGAELSFTPFAKILIFLLAFTIIFGRFFCGYACAFGTLGDWVYQISRFIQKKTGKKIPQIPHDIAVRLQFVKYLVLVVIFMMCFFDMEGDVSKNSPWTVFSLLLSGSLPESDMIAGCVILLLIILGMAVQARFFCQFLCPMGAVFSLMPVLPPGQLVRDRENCIKGCKICRTGCPVSVKLQEEELRDGECIRCNRCISLCPRGNINLGPVKIQASGTVWVIFQAALLLIVLKFVI